MNDQTLPPAGTPVTLREITADTVRAIVKLSVNEAQLGNVASNAVSLAQALFHPEAWYRAVYAGDVPVGFVMVEDETLLSGVARPVDPALSLWRFMIDQRAQGRGFGRAALALVVAHARTRPGITRLLCSCVPGPHSPQGFYEGLGVVATGEIDEGEVVLALELGANQAGPAPPTLAAQALAAKLIRNFNQVGLHREQRAPLYDTACARLGTGTAAEQLGLSIDVVAPGQRACPYHLHHAQEELFIVLEGEGTLRVAGELLPVGPGDVVFVPPGPAYPHQLINTSAAPLKYLSIGTRQTPEIVEYPDSDKFLATVGPAAAPDFDLLARRGASLDYWDGEP